MPDTAVLEAPAAVEATETPLLPEEGPETEGQLAPETTEDTAPETEDWTPPQSKEEQDAIIAAERKSADASARESERRKHETELASAQERQQAAAYQADLARAQAVRREGLGSNLQGFADGIRKFIEDSSEFRDEGKMPANVAVTPEFIQWFAAQVDEPMFMSHYEARKRGMDEWVKRNHPSYRPSQTITDTREKAYASRDWGRVIGAEMTLMEEAITEKLSPALRAEVSTKLDEERKAKEAEAAAKARLTAPKATTLSGQPVRAGNVDDVLKKAHPLSKEYAAAFQTKYGYKPPSP